MKLPNCEQARVPREKITDSLLSTVHRRGGQKAVFFLRFGFSPDAWESFASALRSHACAYEVSEVAVTDFGTLYCVEGPIDTPDGRRPMVRSVWMIDAGVEAPRLISAYPVQETRR